MYRVPLWILCLFLCLSPSTFAQESNNVDREAALKACAALENNAKRLTCYDTVMGLKPEKRQSRNQAPTALVAQPSQQSTSGASKSKQTSEESSALAQRWELDAQSERGPFVVTPYRPTYFFPASYNFDPNQSVYRSTYNQQKPLNPYEVKFQLSFKAKVWPEAFFENADLWLGYTQLSFWQAYNGPLSHPFRETDFEPELIYAYKTDFNLLGLHGRELMFSFEHQSNGQSDPLSRSWNRIIGGALFDNGNFALQVRGWYRLPESPETDDNPGIVSYVGRGDVHAFYKDGQQTFAVMVRDNLQLNPNRGAVQLSWSFPIGGPFKGYVQYFYGYGDGLIDYNHVSNRISFGFILFDWL